MKRNTRKNLATKLKLRKLRKPQKPRNSRKSTTVKVVKQKRTGGGGIIGGGIDLISADNNSFNSNPYVRESHNCYMYFLNKKNDEVVKICKKDYPKHKLCRRAQPGYVSGHPLLKKGDYKCPNIMKRTLDDNPNIYKIDENHKCSPSHYKGALVVAPNRDYHYYRKNDDGQWTHKPGYKPSTVLDSKNNLIVNPRKAARDYGGTLNYKEFCGYLCVPREERKKRMAHWNYDHNTHKGGGKKLKKKRTKNITKHAMKKKTKRRSIKKKSRK